MNFIILIFIFAYEHTTQMFSTYYKSFLRKMMRFLIIDVFRFFKQYCNVRYVRIYGISIDEKGANMNSPCIVKKISDKLNGKTMPSHLTILFKLSKEEEAINKAFCEYPNKTTSSLFAENPKDFRSDPYRNLHCIQRILIENTIKLNRNSNLFTNV